MVLRLPLHQEGRWGSAPQSLSVKRRSETFSSGSSSALEREKKVGSTASPFPLSSIAHYTYLLPTTWDLFLERVTAPWKQGGNALIAPAVMYYLPLCCIVLEFELALPEIHTVWVTPSGMHNILRIGKITPDCLHPWVLVFCDYLPWHPFTLRSQRLSTASIHKLVVLHFQLLQVIASKVH